MGSIRRAKEGEENIEGAGTILASQFKHDVNVVISEPPPRYFARVLHEP
jgi:hypothetical protein